MIDPALAPIELSPDLVDAVRSYSAVREVEHCGSKFTVSAFDFYATCPHCRSRIKLRGFSAHPDMADVFDAFFEWLDRPNNAAASARRRQELSDDE